MKQVILTLTLVFGIQALSAQDHVISNHFSDYQEREDFIKISITGTIFQLMTHMETETEEEEDFKAFVSSITAFNMVIGDEPVFAKSDYRSAINRVDSEYEELMSIEDKDGTFNFLIDEQDGVVREFVMIGLAGEDLIIFSLTGDMDLAQLSRVGSKIQTEGFEYLDKLDENMMEEVKVYPNPVQANAELNIVIPDDYIGGRAVIYDLKGRQVMSYSMGLNKQRVVLGNLSPGQYVIEFENNGRSESRKLEVQ